MLRNAISSSSCSSRAFLKLQSSYLLVRSASTLASSSRLHVGSVASSSPRAVAAPVAVTTATSSRFQSTWALSSSRSSRNGRRGARASSSSRPMINGKPVAFHVSELQQQQQPTAATPASYSQTTSSQQDYDSDLIVLLDMDECLIHSQFLSSPAAAQIYAHQLQQQRRQQHTAAMGAADSFRVTLPDGDLVHVHIRPGLQDFLTQVMERYETHIFTAAMPIYANPVLDQLERSAKRSFAKRWYREHCTYDPLVGGNSAGAYVKNLHRLPQEISNKLDRVVLVDNNPLSFLANPANGILVNSFYTDPTDSTLPAVTDLLQELEDEQDVRPALQERFGLHHTLQDIARSPVNEPEELVEDTTTANSMPPPSSFPPPPPQAVASA